MNKNTLTYHVKTSKDKITYEIFKMCKDFEKQWGVRLKEFLVGPDEYAALLLECTEARIYEANNLSFSRMSTFMGMTIRLKQSSGIEPIFDNDMWSMLLYEKQKND